LRYSNIQLQQHADSICGIAIFVPTSIPLNFCFEKSKDLELDLNNHEASAATLRAVMTQNINRTLI